jgi:hypothetical protein
VVLERCEETTEANQILAPWRVTVPIGSTTLLTQPEDPQHVLETYVKVAASLLRTYILWCRYVAVAGVCWGKRRFIGLQDGINPRE